ncbi:MAG: DHH family phosphoesterase, partial [Eggerthellaceae bacterium]|nr:DHH family phosphoesterase [Eggerthellaceae bacterium]
MIKTNYDIASADAGEVSRIAQEFGLPEFLAYVLVSRGKTDNKEIELFFNPDLERDWNNPYIIPGMKEVVDSLEFAIRSKHKFVIIGDFDVDGITATCVLTRALRILKAEVYPFIPLRTTEGYGITKKSFERMLAECPDAQTVVTVDNGISAGEEVKLFRERGINLIVTDHHEPGVLVPKDVPVCNPKIDPECQSAILSGVGVVLKVVQVIGSRFGQTYLWKNYLDFAMLGTIADLMPMRGENRALCAAGIDIMRKKMRPCFRAM